MSLVRQTKVDKSVLKLIELANVNSPYTNRLISRYCVRMTKRMLKSGKIDYATARHLCGTFKLQAGARDKSYFLLN